jgi:hypothetical protein
MKAKFSIWCSNDAGNRIGSEALGLSAQESPPV